MLRQTSYRALASALVLNLWGLSSDKRLVCQPSLDARKQRVHPFGDGQLTAIKPPRHFGNVLVKMLWRNPMVDADDLTLQERPNRLNGIGVNVALPILALLMVDRLVVWIAGHGAVGRERIGCQHFGVWRNNVIDKFAQFCAGDRPGEC